VIRGDPLRRIGASVNSGTRARHAFGGTGFATGKAQPERWAGHRDDRFGVEGSRSGPNLPWGPRFFQIGAPPRPVIPERPAPNSTVRFGQSRPNPVRVRRPPFPEPPMAGLGPPLFRPYPRMPLQGPLA